MVNYTTVLRTLPAKVIEIICCRYYNGNTGISVKDNRHQQYIFSADFEPGQQAMSKILIKPSDDKLA